MEPMAIVLLLLVFTCVVSVVALAGFAARRSRVAQRSALKKRLAYISAGGSHGNEKLGLMRSRAMSEMGVLERFMFSLPRVEGLDRLIIRSGTSMNVTTFVAISIVMGVGGVVAGRILVPNPYLAPLLGLVSAGLPYALLKAAERKNYDKLEEQLPESLDLMARAMRSGHALSTAIEMVASEMEDPISSEFGAVDDELRFGLSMRDALSNLYERIRLDDLRFFTVAVVLHKETGGNLAEVFEKIARLMRERLRFRRQVKALSAEGRFSAIVMLGLPVALFAYLYLVSPSYLSALWMEQIGRVMVAGAVVMQVAGFLVIRRMIDIKL